MAIFEERKIESGRRLIQTWHYLLWWLALFDIYRLQFCRVLGLITSIFTILCYASTWLCILWKRDPPTEHFKHIASVTRFSEILWMNGISCNVILILMTKPDKNILNTHYWRVQMIYFEDRQKSSYDDSISAVDDYFDQWDPSIATII